ncbi:MAG: hypothetical protein AB9882_06590 [Ignavibacteriaceae bacterium]
MEVKITRIKFKSLLLVLVLIIYLPAAGQINGNRSPDNTWSLRANYNYTTDAKIFFFPNSSDFELRNSYFPLNGITNFSLEFRYIASGIIDIALNLEYIDATKTARNLSVIYNGFTEMINVVDGFYVFPVELTLHYKLPFSSDNLIFSFGGGVGAYYGGQIRKAGNTEVSNTGREIGFGILVGFDLDYYFRESYFLNAGMKFRDPEFRVTSKYDKREIMINGREVLIPQESFESKINIDGILFRVGLGIAF